MKTTAVGGFAYSLERIKFRGIFHLPKIHPHDVGAYASSLETRSENAEGIFNLLF